MRKLITGILLSVFAVVAMGFVYGCTRTVDSIDHQAIIDALRAIGQ